MRANPLPNVRSANSLKKALIAKASPAKVTRNSDRLFYKLINSIYFPKSSPYSASHSVAPLAQIAHPNRHWQLTAKDIASVKGGDLLEIANGHPGSNNLGAGPEAPGAEQICDAVLTEGVRIWGVASDDTHVLKNPWASGNPLPGRGWIVVRAAHLTVDEIIAAIKAGEFYASTGVELKEYQESAKQVAVTVRPRGDMKFRIPFIGKGGRILEEITGNAATYLPKGDEAYVCAKVTDSDGRNAWTQPVFLGQTEHH
jgi:hypothetical protein